MLVSKLFKECCEPVMVRIWTDLCRGPTFVMSATVSVKSDFSLLGMVRNNYQTSLSGSSLNGYLPALQFQDLQKLYNVISRQ